jgi:hypothetical protein
MSEPFAAELERDQGQPARENDPEIGLRAPDCEADPEHRQLR